MKEEANQAIALKEWASTVKALEDGKQILIMRKGGIIEETRDFQIVSPSFYLFPTFEHQKPHLLKEENRSLIVETMEGWSPDTTSVTITCFAEMVEDIEVFDEAQLNKLAPFHIGSEQFAEERLKWKKKNPLHVMLLRVYRLENPLQVFIDPAYLGCKSWVQLRENIQEASRLPVLSEDEFQSRVQAIKAAIFDDRPVE